MAQSKMPRRPAMLDAARADAIIGDEDPAASAAVAHTAAWALMGVGDETFTDADVARLRETVRTSGGRHDRARVVAQPRVHPPRCAVARLPAA